MALDPRALLTFRTVCHAGSISGAARALNLTQPAVSATMRQLERHLATVLFARARAGISLTPAGLALLRRAEALETLLSHAQTEVELAAQNIAGPLMIGGTPGALASLVPQAVAVFRRRHPSFALQIIEKSDDELSDLLRQGRIDMAVITTGAGPPADLVEETISSDPFSLIVGQANATMKGKVSLPSLRDAHWVLPNASGAFRRQVDALFLSSETPPPANVIRCDSLLTTKAIVRDTDCITILPREVVAPELEIGLLHALELEGGFMRRVGVRTQADVELSPLAQAFLAALREGSQK